MKFVKSDNFGALIRKLRKDSGQPLRKVAAILDIDQAIISKMERGLRKATREQVVKLAEYFNVNTENFLVAWLSDKLVDEVSGEEHALQALQVAEDKVSYIPLTKIDINKTIRTIKSILRQFPAIEKAWIYGSCSRNEDESDSDIDIALKVRKKFTYFDLAEVQYELERIIHRKIDIGFIETFKPHIWKNVKSDLRLIYEKE